MNEIIKKNVSKYGTPQYFQLSLILVCLYCQLTLSLKYYYGDGSFYIGDVDEHGRPSGHGESYNTSGALGRIFSLRLNILIVSNLL